MRCIVHLQIYSQMRRKTQYFGAGNSHENRSLSRKVDMNRDENRISKFMSNSLRDFILQK